jgi:hypothetical protein
MIGNNELERTWKEVVMAEFKVLPGNCLKRLMKPINTSGITGFVDFVHRLVF